MKKIIFGLNNTNYDPLVSSYPLFPPEINNCLFQKIFLTTKKQQNLSKNLKIFPKHHNPYNLIFFLYFFGKCKMVDLEYIYLMPIDSLIYQFQRIVQNMSHFNLLADSFLRMPSFPNLNNTLLFIQTNKYLPINSTVSLDQNVNQHLEELDSSDNSLQIKLEHGNHQTISSTSNIRKKKTGCTCKKTKCLKMYCQCFSAGKMCTPECACYGCSNDHNHQDCIQKAREIVKIKTQSATKKSQKGCNCKKSQCQKKYCECFSSGVSCGDHCRCQDCANNTCQSHSSHTSHHIINQQKFESQQEREDNYLSLQKLI